MNNPDYSFVELMIHYLDGSATQAEKAELLRWLRENEENRKSFNDIREIWVSSMSIYSDDLGTEVALDKFRTRMMDYQQKQKIHKKTFRYLWQAVAAACLLIGVAYLLQGQFGKFSTERVLVMNHLIMPEGNKGSVLLPDSTVVWLNSNSKLVYPENFLEDNRTVKLTGEAYFDVVRDENCPFIVQTDNMEITVLGTSFSVSDYDTFDNIGTILRSGSVSVKFKSLDEEFVLHPDEKISFSKINHNTNLEHINAGIHTIWANDKIVFDNDKITDVLQQLEKWYGMDIDYPEQLSPDIRITLTLRKESKEQAFKVISEIAPVEYKIEENKIIIVENK